MRGLFRRAFVDRCDRGASAVEYGLMVAGIAALIVAVAFALSGTFTDKYHDTCTQFELHNHATDQDSNDC
jgi:pilus assembly protein Flp/PilA